MSVRLVVLAALLATAPAAAAPMTPAQRACMGDVVRFCISETVKRCDRCVWRCLRAERRRLSPECAAVINREP